MIRYIHGSQDSLDVDVYYVFDKMPSFKECREFCSADMSENRNIICITDGVVSEVFIGTVDEVNNGLIDTYSLHQQDYPLIVTKRLERNVILKQIRATRGILSILSRTQYRTMIKDALKHNWLNRLDCLGHIRLTEVDFDALGKRMCKEDMLKVIAFQIGQGMALFDGCELYTKQSVAEYYPQLYAFLYRQDCDLQVLDDMLRQYLIRLLQIEFVELDADTVDFPQYQKTYELRHETEV